jgi:hypothetical protein
MQKPRIAKAELMGRRESFALVQRRIQVEEKDEDEE